MHFNRPRFLLGVVIFAMSFLVHAQSASSAPVPIERRCSIPVDGKSKCLSSLDKLAVGRICTLDDDCKASACQDQQCVPGGKGFLGCEKADDCTSKACQDGTCVVGGKGVRCTVELDCMTRRCKEVEHRGKREGKCLSVQTSAAGAPCTDDTDCKNRNCTIDGKCELGGLLGPCDSADDCSRRYCAYVEDEGKERAIKCVSTRNLPYSDGIPDVGSVPWRSCEADADCEGLEKHGACSADGTCTLGNKTLGRWCRADSDCKPNFPTCDFGKCSKNAPFVGNRRCSIDDDCKGRYCSEGRAAGPSCGEPSDGSRSCSITEDCGKRVCCRDREDGKAWCTTVNHPVDPGGKDECSDAVGCRNKLTPEQIKKLPECPAQEIPSGNQAAVPVERPQLVLAPLNGESIAHASVGGSDAPYLLSLFMDPLCGACRASLPGIMDIIGTLVAEGSVRVEFYEFPLRPDSPEERYATALWCAFESSKSEGYLELLSAVYSEAGSILELGDPLTTIARTSLDPETMKRCLESQEAKAAVRASVDYGRRSGVIGTPTSFFGPSTSPGLEFPGRPTEEDLRKLVSEAASATNVK